MFTPSITLVATPHNNTSLDLTPEPKLKPSVPSTAIRSEPTISVIGDEILNRAVKNLVKAASFDMAAHVISAYQILGADGGSSQVYGEFHSNYSVIRLPQLKVYSHHEYRYDPQTDFFRYDSYTYQENDRYFTKIFETSGNSTPAEVELHSIEPISGDVYQTLVTYSDYARFLTEIDNVAVFVLEHPKWYRLESAVGFADLGFLHGQENGESLVEQYVNDHYPHVDTIEFKIFVAINELLITKVEVDNSAFMHSVWAEVDRALIEQGAEGRSLTRYVIMDEHRAEYLFSNYNQVQDVELSP